MVSNTIKESLQRWVDYGVPPGGFLLAVLRNDLGAVTLADAQNFPNIKDIYVYVYNELPSDCWGSDQKVIAWRGKGKEEVEKTNWEEIYDDGNCPDCSESIPDTMVDGGECFNCGHVFFVD